MNANKELMGHEFFVYNRATLYGLEPVRLPHLATRGQTLDANLRY